MTIDLEKVEAEKEKLKALISPAIDNFIKETGLVPIISIAQSEVSTKCGMYKDFPKIYITAQI